MNSTLRKVVYALLATILVVPSACQREIFEPIDFGQKQVNKLSPEVAEEYRMEFAKIMAKAVVREDIRTLLRAEARKQFDNDTDILYQKLKKSKLSDNKTLEEVLGALYGSEDKFNNIVNSLPLLTIFVPSLKEFSVEKWDVKNEIPRVASYPNKIGDGKNQRTFLAFNQLGESVGLQKHVKPSFAVLLVKDNERLFVKQQGTHNARLSFGANRIINEGGIDYDFIDASFDASLNKNNHARRARLSSDMDQEVKDAYDFNLQYHRDYIYYGIAPELGVNTGTLKDNYYEFITSFSFLSTANFDHAVDDPISDWGDGNLEFVINVITVDNRTSLNTLTKGFSANINSFFQYTGDKDNHTVYQVWEYFLPNPIEIFRWDMARWGDTIKFVIYESDPTTTGTTTFQTTTTSTFGFNFNLGVKDGPNFGINYSDVDSRTYTTNLVVNGTPDYLYDGILTWRDNVVVQKFNFDGTIIYGLNDVQTGTISMTVEPRRKF